MNSLRKEDFISSIKYLKYRYKINTGISGRWNYENANIYTLDCNFRGDIVHHRRYSRCFGPMILI
jgi:hypothetical protein